MSKVPYYTEFRLAWALLDAGTSSAALLALNPNMKSTRKLNDLPRSYFHYTRQGIPEVFVYIYVRWDISVGLKLLSKLAYTLRLCSWLYHSLGFWYSFVYIVHDLSFMKTDGHNQCFHLHIIFHMSIWQYSKLSWFHCHQTLVVR